MCSTAVKREWHVYTYVRFKGVIVAPGRQYYFNNVISSVAYGCLLVFTGVCCCLLLFTAVLLLFTAVYCCSLLFTAVEQ